MAATVAAASAFSSYRGGLLPERKRIKEEIPGEERADPVALQPEDPMNLVSSCAGSSVLPLYAVSPVSYCAPVSAALQYHFSRRSAIVEKREHMFLRAMSKAMRYYRIWIYSANVALFLGTLVYSIAFLSVIGDERLSFFPAIRLYQPSFIYSYCAILVQGGLLQVGLLSFLSSFHTL